MTNVDDMLKKMLGKAKSKPVSKPLSIGMPSVMTPRKPMRMGASISMQNQWKSFSKPKQMQLRKRFKDSDGDGVPNRWDCQPHNRFKQDSNMNDVPFSEREFFIEGTEEEIRGEDLNNLDYSEDLIKKSKVLEKGQKSKFDSSDSFIGGNYDYVWRKK